MDDNSFKLPALLMQKSHFIYSVILIFILIYVFPHFILVQPNRISVSSYELIHIHTIDCGWSLDPLLPAVHENGHVFFSPFFLGGFLLWAKFLLLSCHLHSRRKQFIHSLKVSPLSGVHDEHDRTHTCSLLRMSQLCQPIVPSTGQWLKYCTCPSRPLRSLEQTRRSQEVARETATNKKYEQVT